MDHVVHSLPSFLLDNCFQIHLLVAELPGVIQKTVAGVVSQALPIAVAVVLAPVVHILGLLIAADQFVGILFLLDDFFVEAE